MSLWGCAVITVFSAYAISTGDAIKCFECNSDSNPACGDPFYYTHLPLIDCDRKNQFQPQSHSYTGAISVCKKTKTRVNGYYVVDRSCALVENYGLDPCGASRNNLGYRDSNSAYQSSYPNNYGGNYGGNNYGGNQNYGSNNYGNNYGSNNYGSSYGSSYGQDHCSTCRYDACNGATGFAPTLPALLASTIVAVAVKFL